MQLAYGSGEIEVTVPSGVPVDVLEKHPVPPLVDPDAAIRRRLVTPTGARPLHELARGRRDAVIVVSDGTRPVPNAVLLPPILDSLRDAGLPPEAVTVQVATGLHRLNTPDEQHDARDAASHQDLGQTAGGIPILIDRFFLAADLRILTGLIEPHLMAGYSGGRKAVCPGLAAVDTVRVAHGPAMLEGFIGPGLVAGNPLHE
ncbi:MAG: lactate racemase domain-containing protein, partial [Myxococcota bacterium]